MTQHWLMCSKALKWYTSLLPFPFNAATASLQQNCSKYVHFKKSKIRSIATCFMASKQCNVFMKSVKLNCLT